MSCTRHWILVAGLAALAIQSAACSPLREQRTAPGNHANAPAPAGIFWEVSTPIAGASKMFLLGSIHATNPSMFPLDPIIETAFERADGLVVEVDLSTIPPHEIERLENARGTLAANQTLSNTLQPETYRRLQDALDRHGIRSAAVEHLQPWAVALTLEPLELSVLGYSTEDGIDRYFLRKARPRKVVLAFESLDSQIAMLSALPFDAQELLLRDALLDPHALDEGMKALVAAWQHGDVATLENLLLNHPAEPGRALLSERLLFARNAAFTDKLKELLTQPGTWFVVVGAAHLVGERGIVASLRREGYCVQRLGGEWMERKPMSESGWDPAVRLHQRPQGRRCSLVGTPGHGPMCGIGRAELQLHHCHLALAGAAASSPSRSGPKSAARDASQAQAHVCPPPRETEQPRSSEVREALNRSHGPRLD